MELPSLNKSPFNLIDLPEQVTSDTLFKMLDEQIRDAAQTLHNLESQLNMENTRPLDRMMYILLQHHTNLTTMSTKLAVLNLDDQMQITHQITQLNLGLERLNRWLIAMTSILGLLAVDVVLKWLK